MTIGRAAPSLTQKTSSSPSLPNGTRPLILSPGNARRPKRSSPRSTSRSRWPPEMVPSFRGPVLGGDNQMCEPSGWHCRIRGRTPPGVRRRARGERRRIVGQHARGPSRIRSRESRKHPAHVAASTQNQALAALQFLYQRVLGCRNLDWLVNLLHAKRPERLPLVLSRGEVSAVLDRMGAVPALMATLLYGSGLRVLECAELRVEDLDFDRRELTVHDGKGRKDRLTMLPDRLKPSLLGHSHDSAAPRPQRCQDDHELHQRPQSRRSRRPESPGPMTPFLQQRFGCTATLSNSGT